MKKLISAGFMLLLILCVGCGKKETIDLAPVPETVADKEAKQEKNSDVSNEQFKGFFKAYFALAEEDVLILNQNHSKVNEAYWKAHDVYKKKLEGIVKTYFAEEVVKKLSSEYLYDVLHLPKKLVMSDYITFDPQIVESVDIVSVRNIGENRIYEVGVTTKNKVQNIIEANKQYAWNAEKGYYVKETGNTPFIEENSKNTYLNLQVLGDKASANQTTDEIKLIQRYWVEVQPNKALKILSVREASPIRMDAETRQRAENTSHVTRIPYSKEVSAKEQTTIKKVFQKMMSQNQDFYHYYEKALVSSFDVFKEIWQDNMGLDKEVLLVADYYKDAFAPYINPYKDNIYQINADMERIIITPSTYSTQKQPRFIVTIPVKAVLNNNEVIYYNYKYYVGMEENKVECIQFMHMEEITENVYLGKPAEEENNTEGDAAAKEEPKVAETEQQDQTE